MDEFFDGATERVRRLVRGETSSVELTRSFIDRIESVDARINAVVVRDFERALAHAARADAALARGDEPGPLHGLPVTVKESFDVEGLPTTWGLPQFADSIATADALLVERLRVAGAIVLGKTNVPLMLGEFQTANPIHGVTRNPWDLERSPGGSSGGAAAALASGTTGLEFGSDFGGSIRNPAHYCGVYGHKPTWGIIPTRGHAPPMVQPRIEATPDMVVVGPLARRAEDLAVALDVVAGPDPRTTPGWRLELPPPRRTSLKGLRIAVWPDDPISRVAGEISDRVQRVADRLAAQGAVVSDGARPDFAAADARRIYAALTNSLIGANMPDSMYADSQRRARELDPEDTSRRAEVVRSMVLDHRAWLARDRERQRLRAQWRSFFTDWDVLLCPIMATPAVVHDERPPMERTIMVDGEEQTAFHQVFWACLASASGLPATVFPAGPSKEGLPIGLQLIGAEFDDRTTIEVARLIAQQMGGFVAPPLGS